MPCSRDLMFFRSEPDILQLTAFLSFLSLRTNSRLFVKSTACSVSYFPDASTARRLFNATASSFSAKGTDVIVNREKYPVDLSIPGDYNVENAAAAAAACLPFGIPCEEALSALKDFRAPFGRMETFSMEGVPVTICLTKNVVSADNVLSCIASREPDARVVFGFHTNIGDSADRTWIGKISIRPGMDFLEGAIAGGSCTEEIAAALSAHGYSCRKAKKTEEVIPIIQESSRPVYILASYSYMMEIRKLFVNAGYLKNFWKA